MASAQTTCPKNTLKKTTNKEAAVTRREWVLSRNIGTKQRQNYSKGLKGSPVIRHSLEAGDLFHPIPTKLKMQV